jgi:hypothetical protein
MDSGTVFGAGQCIESFIAFDMGMPEGEKPALIALYETISAEGAKENPDVGMAVRLYPSITVQIGLELPLHDAGALTKIGDGSSDAVIKGLAERYKALGAQILLRIGYEFDGEWNGYGEQAYIAAFRRIVDIFRAENASNVEFVWNSYICDNTEIYRWYPGDGFVDWFCFNVVTAKFAAGWFAEEAKKHGKPVMVGEASYAITENGMTFGEWQREFFTMVEKYDIRNFQYINWKWGIYPKSMNWYEWEDGRCTDYPDRVEMMRERAQNGRFVFRDTSKDAYVALAVDCARKLPEDTGSAAWEPAHDSFSAQGGFSYSAAGAISVYADGWNTRWEGKEIAVEIICPEYSDNRRLYVLFLNDSEIKITSGNRDQTVPADTNGFVCVPLPGFDGKQTVHFLAEGGSELRISKIILL